MTDVDRTHEVAALSADPDAITDPERRLAEDVDGYGGPALAAGLALTFVAGGAVGVGLVAAGGLAVAAGAAAVGYAQGVADSNDTSKADAPKPK